MIEGYSYITNEPNVDVACKELVLHYFKDEIPKKLITFMDYKQIVEEILYCEIIESNDRIIFIAEEKLENMTLI